MIVISKILDFRFAIDLTVLLHSIYVSPRGVLSKLMGVFHQKSLYTGYGHSFLSYLFDMIDNVKMSVISVTPFRSFGNYFDK